MSDSRTDPAARRAGHALFRFLGAGAALLAGILVRFATGIYLETPAGAPGYFTSLVPALAGHVVLIWGVVHMVRNRAAPTSRFWVFLPLCAGYLLASFALGQAGP